MNYRHAFHAGNFADVVKHTALTSALLHLRKKETPFAVIDTHAGRGLYNLSGTEAQRTGEADAGITKLRDLSGEMPAALSTYLDIAQNWGVERYPGSPLIAARLLRAQDRLVAIEKHPDEESLLKKSLQPYPKARATRGDGYERLPALLPPPERRGLVLIDPPYESESDFVDAARAVGGALKRFATGIVLIWFPIKSRADVNAFCGEVLAAGAAKALLVEISIPPSKNGEKECLSSAGLVVVNPPFGFDTEMRAALAAIAPKLNGRGEVRWLAGS